MSETGRDRTSSPHGLADLPGLGAIAATYVYFLIWAQFGLLARMRSAGLDAGEIRLAMAAMGLAGLAASFATARLPADRRTVAAGLAACAAAALAALAASSLPGFAFAAAAVGAATAVATVSLAAALPTLVGPARRGLAVGAATGLAYLVCNLPALFEASPAAQARVAATLCLLAAAALRFGPARSGPPRPLPAAPALPNFHGLGWAAVVATFLALVWLDSAAFAIIQESAALRQLTWGAGNVKLVLGAVHLLAALVAGWVIDRGGLLRLPIVGYGALALAALALARLAPGLAAGALYAAGVSLYSVALVIVPAARLEPGLASPGWRSAQLYGIAGWLGSAAGVGMAQDLHRIPGAFLVAAGALLGVAALIGAGPAAARWMRRAALPLAIAVGGATADLAWTAVRSSADALATGGAPAAAVARGRAVYVAEGCIHCHSQFVRPGSRDESLWGPALPLDRAEQPPMVGNRRQGPDLATVGLRRNPVWNRLHLLDPRSITPQSRMPSYAHLFAPGDRRGDDLVEYLASLGGKQGAARQELLARIDAAEPKLASPAVVASGEATSRFGELCSACHGPSGRGDGGLSAHFPQVAIDLTQEPLHHVPDRDLAALERLIRWGAPGTSMAGHETLGAEEIARLAATVASFAPPGAAGSPREGTR